MRRYYNQKTSAIIANGKVKTFDSKGESQRYQYLQEQEVQGVIKDLKIQVKLPLYNTFTNESVGHYIADFIYEYQGRQIIEDYKSVVTVTIMFRLKQAIIESYYQTKVHMVFSPTTPVSSYLDDFDE